MVIGIQDLISNVRNLIAVYLLVAWSTGSISLGALIVYLPSCLVTFAVLRRVYVRRSLKPVQGAVVISGCSSGVGQHLALHLASSGYTVFAGVRKAPDVEKLKYLASSRKIAKKRLKTIILDVTNLEHCKNAARAVKESGLPLAALVNNAGISGWGLSLEFTTDERLQREFDVNVFGVHRLTRELLPSLRKSRGRIIQMGSICGFQGGDFYGVYSSSKFAMRGLTESLRKEMAPFGVHCVSFECGAIEGDTFVKKIRDTQAESESDKGQGIYHKALKKARKVFNQTQLNKTPLASLSKNIEEEIRLPMPSVRVFPGGQAKCFHVLTGLLPAEVFDACWPLLCFLAIGFPVPITAYVFNMFMVDELAESFVEWVAKLVA